MLLTPTSDNGVELNVAVPPFPNDGEWTKEHEVVGTSGVLFTLRFACFARTYLAIRIEAAASTLRAVHERRITFPAPGWPRVATCEIRDPGGVLINKLNLHMSSVEAEPVAAGGLEMEVNDEGHTVPKKLTRAVLERSAAAAEEALEELDEVLEL